MRRWSGNRALVPALSLALGLVANAGHAQSPAIVASEISLPMPVKSSQLTPPELTSRLEGYLSEVWPEARKRGVSRALFERATAGLTPDHEIFDLLANQPEHVATPWDYLNRLASDRRIETGRQKLEEHASLLVAIEARFGVDRHIVLAVWGIESNFGTAPGTRSVIRSLATLAIGDPRRPHFWRNEFLGALTILERGDVALDRMTGSWAGAMGHTQFMPTSYLAHAADFDGDGRRDIWDSIPDALASTAGYLRNAGWQRSEPWGLEVVLPAGFDASSSGLETTRTFEAWQALGVMTPAGDPWPKFGTALSLLLPAGIRGPAFLVTPNFRSILKYNNAVPYALAVAHLADRLRGAAPIAGLWPTDDLPLDKAGREELQRLLAAMGFDLGAVDGVIGNQSRSAVRAAQLRLGLPADGYASVRLLQRLKSPDRN